MKRIIITLFFFLAAVASRAQVNDPVSWKFSYEKKSAGGYDLVLKAAISEGWHIYSIDVPKGGPIATSFRFDTTAAFNLSGRPFEVTKPEEKFDEAFGFKIKTLAAGAEFRQRITSSKASFEVKGSLTYAACNNTTCTPPQEVEFTITVRDPDTVVAPSTAAKFSGAGNAGILSFFISAFLLGLLGVLTPCVYPMIPMTVAFFTRGTANRSKAIINALIFGLSIVVIYTSPGIIITLTGAGAGFANTLSTHWIPNLLFFLLFVVFSASFLGAFEIVLPGSWASSSDSRVDKGGALASFFLALTTVIVSFSCTGPIVGSLLVEAAGGDVLRPTIGMFAFGLAFALPFTVFALFPAILARLPKSGGWLNSVKVVLGFLMLAFSMKFLVAIDSVYHLKLLSREVYLAIWIVLFFLLGMYLLGKIRFSHDSEVNHIGVFRLFLVIVVFSFTVYLIYGLFGAPLNGLSSFLPERTSNSFSLTRPAGAEVNSRNIPSPGTFSTGETCSVPKYGDLFEMPFGLQGYFEYNQGLACAKEQGKPVLLDFKGHACANCKLMEAKVWSDPGVLGRLRNNFVIVSLYADDREQVAEEEWVRSKVDGRVKKTIGKINEDLEISKFGTNALPLYVICDPEGKPLSKPMAANFNVGEYEKWLDEGISAFKSK